MQQYRKLLYEIVDYSCIIKVWEVKGHFGQTMIAQTTHPKR